MSQVSNVFGYKTTEEFLQSVHDPFIPLLVAEGSAHVLQCLSIIADKFNKVCLLFICFMCLLGYIKDYQ